MECQRCLAREHRIEALERELDDKRNGFPAEHELATENQRLHKRLIEEQAYAERLASALAQYDHD